MPDDELPIRLEKQPDGELPKLEEITSSTNIYKMLDELYDEAGIAMHFAGTAVGKNLAGKLFYEFKTDGKEVFGIGKKGIDFAALLLARQGFALRDIEITRCDDTPEGFYIIVKAGLYVLSPDGKEVLTATAFGAKRQDKKMTKNEWKDNPAGGNRICEKVSTADPMAYEKCLSKASRNAKERLITPQLKAKIIEAARQANAIATYEVKGSIDDNGDITAGAKKEKALKDNAEKLKYHKILIDAGMQEAINKKCKEKGVLHFSELDLDTIKKLMEEKP